MTSLESLYLFRNELEGQIPTELANLTNLNWLYIAENEFTGCIPAALRNVRYHDLGSFTLDDCAQGSTVGGVTRDDSIGPRQNDDFDAAVVDIVLPSGDLFPGDYGPIRAKFKNLSPSTGPHGGEATFDVTIYIEPPSGTATRISYDNVVFTLNQERTLPFSQYAFATAGTYTVWAEIYDNMGLQSGWNTDNRFDQLNETIMINSHAAVTVQFGMANFTVNEVDRQGEIEVTISASPTLNTSVRLETSDITAVSPQDYRAVSIILHFDEFTTDLTKTFTVMLVDDRMVESAEMFKMELSGFGNSNPYATVSTQPAIVTIQDNDEATVEFSSEVYTVNEGGNVRVGGGSQERS